MLVTSEEFPLIIKAFNCVNEETGGLNSLSQPVRDIPDRWREYLPEIEKTIRGLSFLERAKESEPIPPHVKPNAYLDSEFYTFCNGEYHEMQGIENRDMRHTLASLLLNDYFEDWQLTGDEKKSSPTNVARQRRLEWLQSLSEKTSEQQEEFNRLQLELV